VFFDSPGDLLEEVAGDIGFSSSFSLSVSLFFQGKLVHQVLLEVRDQLARLVPPEVLDPRVHPVLQANP
jgi:hypothetical protein